MLRWMGPKGKANSGRRDRITDDPLAAIDPGRKDQGIYSVSRSVRLPRIKLRHGDGGFGCNALENDNFRVNPIFVDGYTEKSPYRPSRKHQTSSRSSRQSTPFNEKSSSSGYGGSHDAIFTEPLQLKDDAVSIISQNHQYVKSIKVATRSRNPKSQTQSSGSSGTLSTIPEGKVDFSIPRPIWPRRDYDSLVDEAMLLYTSLSYKPERADTVTSDVSIKDVLVELLGNITATIEGKGVLSPEEMLKRVNEKITLSLDALKNVTEEEMRLLCVNLRNSQKVSSVIRALSSSSGNSSQSSPEWSSRARTLSSDTEDVYQIPSGSSSSGFSDIKPFEQMPLPMFVHEDLASVPNGMRNAMIYGTLCRTSFKTGDRLLDKEQKGEVVAKKSLLKSDDDRPSVWEQYYGVNVGLEVSSDRKNYVPKPTDIPIFPGGRPEADFTLDVPRSELLTKRMKQDKKWRCRCRILTTFLGLVFFLLSVMAVSLMLTRGKRMFGSMV